MSGGLVGFWKGMEFHSLSEGILVKELPAAVVRVKELNDGCCVHPEICNNLKVLPPLGLQEQREEVVLTKLMRTGRRGC